MFEVLEFFANFIFYLIIATNIIFILIMFKRVFIDKDKKRFEFVLQNMVFWSYLFIFMRVLLDLI